jgi:hypothetical protein
MYSPCTFHVPTTFCVPPVAPCRLNLEDTAYSKEEGLNVGTIQGASGHKEHASLERHCCSYTTASMHHHCFSSHPHRQYIYSEEGIGSCAAASLVLSHHMRAASSATCCCLQVHQQVLWLHCCDCHVLLQHSSQLQLFNAPFHREQPTTDHLYLVRSSHPYYPCCSPPFPLPPAPPTDAGHVQHQARQPVLRGVW